MMQCCDVLPFLRRSADTKKLAILDNEAPFLSFSFHLTAGRRRMIPLLSLLNMKQQSKRDEQRHGTIGDYAMNRLASKHEKMWEGWRVGVGVADAHVQR
mmetsp:Transcript_27986/g.71213  ORF Transcript_27986/g.71213 Transcript_27986/m.71213 type:complete len:99 (-) Transcript_27986:16-312(-)